MKTRDNGVYDLESPLDFWEMVTVTWIRLVASAAHTFVVLQAPRPAPAGSETSQARAEAENEALLHVLE